MVLSFNDLLPAWRGQSVVRQRRSEAEEDTLLTLDVNIQRFARVGASDRPNKFGRSESEARLLRLQVESNNSNQ